MLIYKAIFPNNKIYIGQTQRTLEYRKKEHWYEYLKNRRNSYFYNAIKKYGWDNIKWEIVENNIINIDILNEREMFYISKYNTFGDCGYNMNLGGNNKNGCIVSQETRKKMSEYRKGKPALNLGKIRSEEAKKKTGDANRGRCPWNKGKKVSNEIKKKMSISLMGHSTSQETKNKISKSNKGKIRSEEIKKQWSNSHKGKIPWNKGKILPKLSEQLRKRLSDIHKNIWAKRKQLSEGEPKDGK